MKSYSRPLLFFELFFYSRSSSTLCGASLPEKFKRILQKYEFDKDALFDAGMIYAVNQIVDLVAHDAEGIHVYTMNNPVVAKRICDSIKNLI